CMHLLTSCFFFNLTSPPDLYTLSLHDALPILLSLLLPSLLIMFIPSTFKRPVSSWKALNLRKTLLMASSVRLKPLNNVFRKFSRSEERFSRNAETDLVCRLLLEKKKSQHRPLL